DSHPIFEDYTIPTFVRKDAITHLPISVSRIDTIWISSSLCPDILQAETWDTEAFHDSDHNMIITYLAKDLLFGSISQAHLKQNKIKRKVFAYKRMDEEKWSDFARETDVSLLIQSSKFPSSTLISKSRLMEQNDINEQIRRHADIRCDNFSDNESKFINSSLDRTKRTIVIDRVFKSNPSSSPILLTHPYDIKKEVINHFQNFV